MKVEIEDRRNNAYKKFEEIGVGELFEMGGSVWVKIGFIDGCNRAIDLSDGTIALFLGGSRVTKLNKVKVIIEE